jgi:hypothetical protein
MRVLVDHSCVEVYLSSGEVLSTRIYRGQPPHGSDAGIDFVAYGGTARIEVRSSGHPLHARAGRIAAACRQAVCLWPWLRACSIAPRC